MIHRLVGTLVLVIVTLTMSSASFAQQLQTLRVAGPPIDPLKALHYAKESGIFRKYGLNVEITHTNSGSAALAALSGGSIDIANSGITSVMQAYLRGVKFQVVAPNGWYLSDRPQVQLLVKKSSPLRTGKDLNGKTIASSSLRDINIVAVFAWVDQSGGDSKSIRVVEIPSPAIQAALEEGRIDAAPLATPFMDQALAAGTTRVLSKPFDAIGKRIEVGSYVATADFVEKNEDVVRRFALAMHESIVYTNSHLAETAPLVAAYSGVDVAVVSKAMRATDPEYVEARNIQPVIDVAAKYGLLDRRFDASEIISGVALKPR
jgi:NitT/TauT family transport system substrate-binding protein